ncbi:peptidyl-prolyl cis-trans isomerase [Aspergillus steynii IBT 23096]|uniref:peptidylprolyl isomerase n=1 Tax=Aspergillus steynii IBT 23096 TaxID=1392250 RepID=A0A2I2GCK9_9EURO|nr:peptidyl-prolyl cis-trans isomerase [Aspergillus steynii IBT 23096]PLB50600.1 peptidyl-prolyl cis-trans isomerase [Aspergillus steynii IBT 23096]
MGVTKQILQEGNKQDYPQKGDQISMHYTGCLYDENAPNKMGTKFDSSVGRGPFKTAIGVGRLIQGWDEGVPTMSLGEKAILTITGDYGYGASGFPGLIPPNATLVFEVQLIGINNKAL